MTDPGREVEFIQFKQHLQVQKLEETLKTPNPSPKEPLKPRKYQETRDRSPLELTRDKG